MIFGIKEIAKSDASESKADVKANFNPDSRLFSENEIKMSETHGEQTETYDPDRRKEGFFLSKQERMEYVPPENSKMGKWTGEPGNSTFIPNADTEIGKKAIDKLKEYNLKGIEYHNGVIDYSKCSEVSVKIPNMTVNMRDNFKQADIACAEKWNKESKDGRTDWNRVDVADYRRENHLSWHERNDTVTCDLVSQDIHGNGIFLHSGGRLECKKRDAIEAFGGKYDPE